jgi:hypothetical protein
MIGDDHVDGNAVGSRLIDAFGREMTNARACCSGCGAINHIGAFIAFTRAPGEVLRCPACEAVMLVIVASPTAVRISFVSMRWLEPAGG